MGLLRWLLQLLLLCTLCQQINGIRWLALSKIGSVSTIQPPEQMCEKIKGSLIKKQLTFCKRNPTFMDSVRLGAARAIDECQFQFRSRRWNCSTLEDKMQDDLSAIRMELGEVNTNNRRVDDDYRSNNRDEYQQRYNGRKMDPDEYMHSQHQQQAINLPYKSASFGRGGGGGGNVNLNSNGGNSNNFGASAAYSGYGGSALTAAADRRREANRRTTLRRGKRLSRKARNGGTIPHDDDDEEEEDEEEETPVGRKSSSNVILSNAVVQQQQQPQQPQQQQQQQRPPMPLHPPPQSHYSSRNESMMEPEMGGKKRRNNNKQQQQQQGKDLEDEEKENTAAAVAEEKKKASWQKAIGSYPVVSPGTREMAFVHAISSAGVAHALTRACSSGELENCGCDRSLRGTSPQGFEWSGCSDNVDFGITFSRNFVDARDRRKSRKKPNNAQPLMNLHNNEAGRKLLERKMKVECKCHGVSGSCELKTCWRQIASFREIGELLKEKFDNAHEVQQKRKRGRRMLLSRDSRFKPHTDTDLVYLKLSPDYCEYDITKGSLGTHGRECNPRSSGIDGCELMCCNRGFTTRREKRVERCKCKFHWCCFVECEECYREVEVNTCN